MGALNYLSNVDAGFIEEIYEKYLINPDLIDESWRYFFDGLDLGSEESLRSSSQPKATRNVAQEFNGQNGNGAKGATVLSLDLSAEAKVADLINAYRERGRLLANIDPLNAPCASHQLLELSNFGLTQEDLDRTFTAGKFLGIGPAKLKIIIERLKQIYCASIAVEYTHIQDPDERIWLQNHMETTGNQENLDQESKRFILKRLTDSETFERFLHTRYVAQKRFSIEGGESLIPCLDRIIEVSADFGANNVVMGMAHRGRLNVLINTYGKKADHIFTEFEDNYKHDAEASIGDVKYHKGFSADVKTRNQKNVHLSLAHNPSHLEFVNPVVEGICRAKQRDLKDKDRTQVIPILIHGDSAFAGQGIVYETLNLSQLRGYETGGTIHVVIDNQVGFTTSPIDTRSTRYSTDVCKMLDVPIFHVNGDDPESLWFVARLATEYRQKFHKDVIIDIICYRKYGHNEGDEPTFTQPMMYKKIKIHPSPREVYAKKLRQEGVVDEAEAKAMVKKVTDFLAECQKITRSEKPKPFSSSYQNKWAKLKPASEEDIFRTMDTKVAEKTIKEIANSIYQMPNDFNIHPKLDRFYAGRLKAVNEGKGIDWGNGETLAYATLLKEGFPIRLSGQDVQRGTFTHRHAVLHDFETGNNYIPLNHIGGEQAEFIIFNSHLSESGVLGFEYGWSLADPSALVIWEAQFGDFANGAQVIIDQFIASSEAKWRRASGIVLNLPHGYEGQGPEHSSARLERFLQLCAENNMSVCNFTTPAQLFHALRRQMKRGFRKPMVIMTPKSLLRHPMAVSNLKDFTESDFFEILDDTNFSTDAKARRVKRVVICSGKVYYDLLAAIEKYQVSDIAILRLEQIYPWPKKALKKILARYSAAKKIVWTQEEPRNMGAWGFIFNHWAGGLENFVKDAGNREITYAGREASAAPAVGSLKESAKQQEKFIFEALMIKKK